MNILLIAATLSLSILCQPALVHAQDLQDGDYFTDAQGQKIKEKKAVSLLHVSSVGDSCQRFDYYHAFGPLIRTETYPNGRYTMPHGFFAWYNASGGADSTGYFANGLRDGFWEIFNEKTQVTRQRKYVKGVLVEDTTYDVAAIEAARKNRRDSLAEGEDTSAFPGGGKAWLKWLVHKQVYPDRAVDHDIQGEVRVMFIIDTLGNVQEPVLLRSVEYSLDQEAVSVINRSPVWIPARKKGRKVKSWKIQPVIYRMRK